MTPDPAWLDASCPWSGLRSLGLPNVNWCEPSRCSWIAEPSTTWSNIAYLIAAYIIRREMTGAPKEVRILWIWVLLMGAFSLIYHASLNWPLQIMDFFGMFLFTGWMFVLNLRRLKFLSTQTLLPGFISFMIVSMSALFIMRRADMAYQSLVGIQVGLLLVTELWARWRGEDTPWRWLAVAGGFFFVGSLFSAADASRAWCQPDNLILHGHAIWHVLGGLGAWAAARHYRSILGE